MSPNRPKTQHRSIRVPDERWDASLERARSEGTKLAAVVNEFLEAYATGDPAADAFLEAWRTQNPERRGSKLEDGRSTLD